MFCFRCGTPLEEEFFHGKLNLVCPKCKTRTLSVSALRTLLETPDISNRLWRASDVAFEENGSVCPVCKSRLRQVYMRVEENAPKIELDVCRKCQMFCFDPGELEQLPVLQEKPKEFKHEPNRNIDMSKPMDLPDDMPAFAGDDERFSDMLLGAMGVPVDREGGTSHHPWVTYALLLLCAAGLVISGMYGLFGRVSQLWGFIPSAPFRWFGATFVTSAFLHTGLVHFAGNIYFLWLSGKLLEQVLSLKKMLLLFVLSLLTSKIFYLLTAVSPDTPCVGASGFIAGFMACCAVLFPCRKLSFMFRNSIGVRHFFGIDNVSWIELPFWFCFILWFGFQTACAILSPDSGTAFTSHIGGSISGAVYGIILRRRAEKCDLL